MTYLILFFLLLIFTAVELIKARKTALAHVNELFKLQDNGHFDNPVKMSSAYMLMWIIMTLFVSLRYGQGSDYFGYMNNYVIMPVDLGLSRVPEVHGDWGFQMLMKAFILLRLPYEAFVFFVSAISMLLIHFSIKKYSPLRLMSLLLLYPTVYLTYIFSAIRQGLTVAIFLGLMVQCLYEKKYIKYYVFSIIATVFHSSAALLMVIPVCNLINLKYIKKLLPFSAFFPAIGYLLYISPLPASVKYYIGSDGGTLFANSYNIFSVAERVIMVLICYLLYNTVKTKSSIITLLLKIYLTGFLLFAALTYHPFIAQRLTMPFKAVEIILVPLLLYSLLNSNSISIRKTFAISKSILITAIATYCAVFTVKNIASYIDQGAYYDKSLINYPYVSVFNKNDIFDKRPVADHMFYYINK